LEGRWTSTQPQAQTSILGFPYLFSRKVGGSKSRRQDVVSRMDTIAGYLLFILGFALQLFAAL